MNPATTHYEWPLRRLVPLLFVLALLSGVCAASGTSRATWQLVDEGACEGPIITYTLDHFPEEGRCTPEMAGKAALCLPEVCPPHCLYFDYPLEQCQIGADLGKRYTCVAN